MLEAVRDLVNPVRKLLRVNCTYGRERTEVGLNCSEVAEHMAKSTHVQRIAETVKIVSRRATKSRRSC